VFLSALDPTIESRTVCLFSRRWTCCIAKENTDLVIDEMISLHDFARLALDQLTEEIIGASGKTSKLLGAR